MFRACRVRVRAHAEGRKDFGLAQGRRRALLAVAVHLLALGDGASRCGAVFGAGHGQSAGVSVASGCERCQQECGLLRAVLRAVLQRGATKKFGGGGCSAAAPHLMGAGVWLREASRQLGHLLVST